MKKESEREEEKKKSESDEGKLRKMAHIWHTLMCFQKKRQINENDGKSEKNQYLHGVWKSCCCFSTAKR